MGEIKFIFSRYLPVFNFFIFIIVMDQRTTSSDRWRDKFLLHVSRSVYQLLAVIKRAIYLFNVVRDVRTLSFLYFIPNRMFCLIYGTIIDVNTDKILLWTLCVYRTNSECASAELNRFLLGRITRTTQMLLYNP